MKFQEIIQAINIKPYYQDSAVVIYNADCRDVLPKIPDKSIDLVLTDPPYGINLNTDYSQRKGTSKKKVWGNSYSALIGDDGMDLSKLMNFPLAVIWGANNFPMSLKQYNPLIDGWICWDKRVVDSADAIIGSPFELAYVKGKRLYKIIRLQHCGVKNADGDNSGRFHPTQKPITLFSRILIYFPMVNLILDPFLGSGTTAYCAKKLGRKCIGIEIEEKYCEIAAKRCSQAVMNLNVEPEKKVTQLELG